MFPALLAVLIAKGAPLGLSVYTFAIFANLAAALTHYGTTPGPMIFAHGYVGRAKWWQTGLLATIGNLAIWSTVGFLWWKLIGIWYPALRSPFLQRLVQRSLPVTFQIQRDVVKPERLENSRERAAHLQVERARQLLRSDLAPHQLPMKPDAELAEPERANGLFAALHGLDVLNRHRSAIRNP